MERNILLTIEYDGSGFHGWQRQPEVRTVQGELERVLSHICGMPVAINGTSRTVFSVTQNPTISYITTG